MSNYFSKFTGEELDAIMDEIIEARNGRLALGRRIDTLSNFASPNAGPNISGRWYDNSLHGTGSATVGLSLNRLDLSPFYTSQPLTIAEAGVQVTTAGAGGVGKICVYDSSIDGTPKDLIYVSPELSFAATGFVSAPADIVFEPARQYWLGVHVGGTASLSAVSMSSLPNFGLANHQSTGTASYATAVRRHPVQTYDLGPPLTWDTVQSALVAGNAVSIRMRCA